MSETTTLTLTDFLLARIAEDEDVARAAITQDTQERTYYDGRTETLIDTGIWHAGSSSYDECRVEGTFMVIYDEGGHSPEQATHIARHDPARVLAECEAKRQIVELHAEVEKAGASCAVCWEDYPCPTLRILTSVYADHPDFREEWRA